MKILLVADCALWAEPLVHIRAALRTKEHRIFLFFCDEKCWRMSCELRNIGHRRVVVIESDYHKVPGYYLFIVVWLSYSFSILYSFMK